MATDTNHDGTTGTRERDTAPAGADAAPTPTADTAVTVEVVPLDTLTPLTDNPRTHTARGIDFLKASLGRVGAARSGVIDEARTILAGNGMQDAATQVGYREAVVVTTDGTRPVFVQRTGLSTTQKARLIVDDNRASELSAWNPTLATYADQDPSLKADWTRPEWRAAVGRDAPTAGRTDPDATPAARSTPIRLGDQFRLHAHVVRCGDSTAPAHVDALLGGATPHLMPTDPPYGVNYAPEWRAHVDGGASHAVGRVANDHRADWTTAYRLFTGDVVYVWHAGLYASTVAASLQAAGFDLRAQIIWQKQHFALSRGDYHYGHEPCWYAVRTGRTSRWQGDRTQSTVWAIPNRNPFGGHATGADADTGHATQKPVALFEIPIRNHTEPGEAIYDPFAGSGTALIAAERLGRSCYAMELVPEHVQRIIDRWEAFTGQTASKVAGS